MLETPEQIRQLQRKLYQKAKQGKKFKFYLLYDKVFRLDILGHAYDLVRENKGAAGVDGLTFESIEGTEGGAQEYLENIARELKAKTYKPMPVRRVYIPKADGGNDRSGYRPSKTGCPDGNQDRHRAHLRGRLPRELLRIQADKQLTQVRNYLENRVRKHLMRRRRLRGWGFKRSPCEYLYEELGLCKIPTTAPWKTANAAG